MRSGIIAAWLAGESIVLWRIIHRDHALPAPGVLLGISGLFLAGAIVAEVMPKTETLVLATLVGLDIAALMNVLPAGLSGKLSQAEQASASAVGSGGARGASGTTQAPGTSTAAGRG